MLAEFQALADSRGREIERGQTYVNSFLTIASGVAALVAIISQISPESFSYVGIWILAILFLTGIISYTRIVERDIRINTHARRMTRIRRFFAEMEPCIKPYLPFPITDDKPTYFPTKSNWISQRNIIGLINDAVGATLAYLILNPVLGAKTTITLAAGVFVILLVLHELYAIVRWRSTEKSAEVRFPSSNKQPQAKSGLKK